MPDTIALPGIAALVLSVLFGGSCPGQIALRGTPSSTDRQEPRRTDERFVMPVVWRWQAVPSWEGRAQLRRTDRFTRNRLEARATVVGAFSDKLRRAADERRRLDREVTNYESNIRNVEARGLYEQMDKLRESLAEAREKLRKLDEDWTAVSLSHDEFFGLYRFAESRGPGYLWFFIDPGNPEVTTMMTRARIWAERQPSALSHRQTCAEAARVVSVAERVLELVGSGRVVEAREEIRLMCAWVLGFDRLDELVGERGAWAIDRDVEQEETDCEFVIAPGRLLHAENRKVFAARVRQLSGFDPYCPAGTLREVVRSMSEIEYAGAFPILPDGGTEAQQYNLGIDASLKPFLESRRKAEFQNEDQRKAVELAIARLEAARIQDVRPFVDRENLVAMMSHRERVNQGCLSLLSDARDTFHLKNAIEKLIRICHPEEDAAVKQRLHGMRAECDRIDALVQDGRVDEAQGIVNAMAQEWLGFDPFAEVTTDQGRSRKRAEERAADPTPPPVPPVESRRARAALPQRMRLPERTVRSNERSLQSAIVHQERQKHGKLRALQLRAQRDFLRPLWQDYLAKIDDERAFAEKLAGLQRDLESWRAIGDADRAAESARRIATLESQRPPRGVPLDELRSSLDPEAPQDGRPPSFAWFFADTHDARLPAVLDQIAAQLLPYLEQGRRNYRMAPKAQGIAAEARAAAEAIRRGDHVSARKTLDSLMTWVMDGTIEEYYVGQ